MFGEFINVTFVERVLVEGLRGALGAATYLKLMPLSKKRKRVTSAQGIGLLFAQRWQNAANEKLLRLGQSSTPTQRRHTAF